jgi:myo-inositol-1(or 4)-monophosphatase
LFPTNATMRAVDRDGHRLLVVAKRAAALASEVVRSHTASTVTTKGERDFASNVDLVVEKRVRDFLSKHVPEAGFLGEEGGGSDLLDGLNWVLDPIDGTVNFFHGLPLCAVSLSLLLDGVTLAGVVDLPFLGHRYSGLRGQGSYVNDQQLQVSSTNTLSTALISIDQFTFSGNVEERNRLRLRLTEQLASRVQRVRMLGASAIDLVWTAEGRLDGCIILGNKPWDTSAGVLIAREAGARVLDQDGSEHSPDSGATIAVTPALEGELMELLHSCST